MSPRLNKRRFRGAPQIRLEPKWRCVNKRLKIPKILEPQLQPVLKSKANDNDRTRNAIQSRYGECHDQFFVLFLVWQWSQDGLFKNVVLDKKHYSLVLREGKKLHFFKMLLPSKVNIYIPSYFVLAMVSRRSFQKCFFREEYY